MNKTLGSSGDGSKGLTERVLELLVGRDAEAAGGFE